MSHAPRRTCPVCQRSIAVVGGRYARHDPPERVPGELVSCPGSLKSAPLTGTGQDEELDLELAETGSVQPSLF